MKNLFSKILFVFILSFYSTFSQNYTWIKGSNALDQPGIYGSLGIATNSTNPGGREYAATWKDAAGNLWLFGGSGLDAQSNDDFMNDLWKYDIVTNKWTWIKGDSISGSAGIYGTLGVANSNNKPGGRGGSAIWQDASGNVWIFGGNGYDATATSAELNDLWKYTPSSNQWTWMGGSSLTAQTSVYGTMGTAAPGNRPGARYGQAFWQDASGNFWLFGGSGFDNGTTSGALSDLWKYNPTSNQWTWVKGNNTIDQFGTYGTQGVAATNNLPGGRYFGNMVKDATGNFWLFGGVGFAASGLDDVLNDLWKYNPVSNEWTWMKGSNLSNQIGNYGTIKVSSNTNTPGARARPIFWPDQNGDLILFGGYGNALNSANQGDLNDTWQYNFITNNWTWLKGNASVNAKANYGTLNVLAAANKIGSRFDAMAWPDGWGNAYIFGGVGYVATGNTDGYLNDLWRTSACISQSVSISSNLNVNTICRGETVTLTANGATSYSWSTSQTVNTIVVSPTIQTTYTLTNADGLSCGDSNTLTIKVLICENNIVENSNQKSSILLYPNPNNGAFNLILSNSNADIIIYNHIGQIVFEKNLQNTVSNIETSLSKGLYYYSIQENNTQIGFGKLLIE